MLLLAAGTPEEILIQAHQFGEPLRCRIGDEEAVGSGPRQKKENRRWAAAVRRRRPRLQAAPNP